MGEDLASLPVSAPAVVLDQDGSVCVSNEAWRCVLPDGLGATIGSAYLELLRQLGGEAAFLELAAGVDVHSALGKPGTELCLAMGAGPTWFRLMTKRADSGQLVVVHIDISKERNSELRATLELAALGGRHASTSGLDLELAQELCRAGSVGLFCADRTTGRATVAEPGEAPPKPLGGGDGLGTVGLLDGWRDRHSTIDDAVYALVGGCGPSPTTCAIVLLGAPRRLDVFYLFFKSEPCPAALFAVAALRAWVGEAIDAEVGAASRPDSGVRSRVSSGVREHDFESMAKLASGSDVPVLLLGESGVGKTRLARLIHDHGHRRDRPFLDLNCAGLLPALLESELFGHERGAFTGAGSRKLGLLEAVKGGTVLLDEVGELDIGVQAKLLKVLETQRFRRVGGSVELSTDVRFIAATHRDLWARVKSGEFRQDLLYRLNVVQISVPALRDNPWKVWELAEEMLDDIGARTNKAYELEESGALALLEHGWPGNIRELRNVLERVALFSSGRIRAEHVQAALGKAPRAARPKSASSLASREQAHIEQVLKSVGFNVRRAASVLGISRSTLYQKIRRFGIDLDEGRRSG